MGTFIAYTAGFLLFLVDLYSLYLLNLEYGLMWAFIAFMVFPLQVLVPFLVGTWPYALGLFALQLFGTYLMSRKEL